MKTINGVTLKDALNNFAPRSGASDEYCKGLVVGLAAGLIAGGLTWREATTAIKQNWPRDGREVNDANCPESWTEALR
jgi:hypothetical protein